MSGYYSEIMESILGDDRTIRRLRFSQDVWDYMVKLDKEKGHGGYFGVWSCSFNGIPAVLDKNLAPGSFVKEYVIDGR